MPNDQMLCFVTLSSFCAVTHRQIYFSCIEHRCVAKPGSLVPESDMPAWSLIELRDGPKENELLENEINCSFHVTLAKFHE